MATGNKKTTISGDTSNTGNTVTLITSGNITGTTISGNTNNITLIASGNTTGTAIELNNSLFDINKSITGVTAINIESTNKIEPKIVNYTGLPHQNIYSKSESSGFIVSNQLLSKADERKYKRIGILPK
jgi:hypothetical protein